MSCIYVFRMTSKVFTVTAAHIFVCWMEEGVKQRRNRGDGRGLWEQKERENTMKRKGVEPGKK